MKKIISYSFRIFLITICLIFNIISFPKAFSDVNLLENSPNDNKLPNHFRMTTDIISLSEYKDLNLSGLDKLNISGSGQFSETGLDLIKKSLPSNLSIIDIDLRQESHGFINGIGVSFENPKNNANKGLTLPEVLSTEKALLQSIKINTPLTFYNTKVTVTPDCVKDELTLTSNKNIGYIRIPVTDGSLPSDEMVDYFIDIVKNTPENAWYHFHCKEGIGRTTTFMIMYDIMRNHKEVSLNDIIKRQVLLSTIKEKDAQSFYTGKHFEFLNSFYNKVKAKTTSSITFEYLNSDDCYIKNSNIPKHLYVISDKYMTNEEQSMISALQGIISTKSNKQIYILTNNEPDYKIWLEDLEVNYNITYENISDPWILLDKFKSSFNGYILYSNENPPSINNAFSLAGLSNSLPIEKSLEEKFNKLGINTLIKDCINTDKYWAYKNLWNSGLNHSTVILLSPEKSMALRDYAIMSKSLVFYEEDVKDFSLREDIFKSMDKVARCLGWGPDEFNNVSISSKYGVDMIAADWSYNLSVLSSFPANKQVQKSNNEIPRESNVHYVTFIMSDGDNQQWLLGSNYSSEKWYGSKNRGNFDLGWSLSPSLYYLAPTVFNKYYESASSDKYSDYYLVSPSGNGYIYPSMYPESKLNTYTKRLNEYMKKVNQKYVLIIDDDAFYKTNLWNNYTENSNIDGLFYLDYKKNNNYKGEIVWSNNKPVVSCRDLLWGDLEDSNQLIENINSRTNTDNIDITKEDAYTFVYLHVWSNDMNILQNVVTELNKNPKVKIITPDVFIKLIKDNINPK